MTLADAHRLVRLAELARKRGDRATSLILETRVIAATARYGVAILQGMTR